MRTRIAALAVLLCTAAAFAMDASPAAAEETVVIGRLNPTTGQATLYTDRLRKTFPDGGSIKEAYLQKRANGDWVLVRAGTLADATSTCWSEIFHTGLEGNDFVLTEHLVPVFSCAEVEDRCKPSGMNPVLCIPTSDEQNCACRPPQFAAPAPSPKCKKVYEWLSTSLWDIVLH